MTKNIAAARTIRRRIAAQLDAVYYAQVDVMNVREARAIAARFGARSYLVDVAGPAGWPVLEVASRNRALVRRVVRAFGYGTEATIDVR